ncbi:MAG: glycosyltransferase [Patescibacteria group bacterium]|jgi:glycosyltransferase involved in cell wall biosynthesis/putative flippase GtrA
MKQIYRSLKKHAQTSIPWVYGIIDKNKVFAKYLISGCTAAATDLGLLFIFTDLAGLWYVFSAAIAFAAAFFVSFFLQKFWTFRDNSRDKMRSQMAVYLSVGLINLGVNSYGLYLLVEYLSLWYLLAQIIMGIGIAVYSFLIYKFFIFSKINTGDAKTGNGKILIATGIFPPDIGGPATMLGAMVNSLIERGFRVKIITYISQKSKVKSQKSDVEITKINRGKYITYFFQMFRLARWTDVIYVTDTYSVGYFAYLIKRITGKKYVVRFAGDSAWETAVAKGWTGDYILDFQQRKYDDKIEKFKNKRRKILVNADRIIAVSNFMAGIARAIGVEESKIQTIYNSVDFIKNDSFDAGAVENIKKQYGNNNKIMMTACRLTPWKGVAGIIKIMPKLDNVNFLVLGDGQEMENLKKLASELGVENRVYFLGKIKQAEMINYFKAADLFILNTNYEGLSHTILEAMSAGAPVLTTNAGGNPEVIENNKDGLLVNFNNEQELLEAAIKILNNKEFADNLVVNAKTKLHKFNWSNTVESTAKLLKEI